MEGFFFLEISDSSDHVKEMSDLSQHYTEETIFAKRKKSVSLKLLKIKILYMYNNNEKNLFLRLLSRINNRSNTFRINLSSFSRLFSVLNKRLFPMFRRDFTSFASIMLHIFIFFRKVLILLRRPFCSFCLFFDNIYLKNCPPFYT